MENNHSEIIHAWVCGAEIQCKPKQNGEWKDTEELHLDSSFEYQVNPKRSKAYYKDNVNLGDTFWYISPYLTVEETVWDGSRDKLRLVECGNAFMSNEEAVRAIKAIRITRRLFIDNNIQGS